RPWDRQWSGESPAYRPRAGMENVNTVVGPLPSTGRILRADPRRTWDGSLPVAVPAPAAAPVTGGAARPSRPATQGQDVDPVTVGAPKPRDRGEGKAKQPTQADPRTRRSWSEGNSNEGGKSPPPAPQAGNAGGGRSNAPSTPQAAPSSGGGGSKPSAPSSGTSGRRRG
ncbi:MAG TPA: hypothetical protein VFY20_01660, partial [Gemmatimonadales bacterium]|nr:hypothetical protein [Gemmatimonadales bacterium]